MDAVRKMIESLVDYALNRYFWMQVLTMVVRIKLLSDFNLVNERFENESSFYLNLGA